MAAVTICSDFGAPKNKVWHCFHCFPIYLPWNDGTRCHDLHFLNVGWALSQLFHSSLSLSSSGFFSSSSLSAIRVVSSVYLRLLIFLPAILILVSVSSSPAFFRLAKKRRRVDRNFFLTITKNQWIILLSLAMENSERDGKTRPPDLFLEKSVSRSGSNS